MQKHDKKCLYFVPRILLKDQFDLELLDKQDRIKLMTYQQLEAILMKGEKEPTHYDFIVADECHYFTSDSNFNPRTDISFNWIMRQNTSIKIFMSATIKGFIHLLQYVSPVWHSPIRLPQDYSYIDKLTFFTSEEHIEQIANEVIANNKKAIFFLSSVELTYKIYQDHKGHMIFAVSSSNKHFKDMDHTAIERMIGDKKFDTNILITTTVLDSGFTLRDSAIDVILTDIFDPEEIVQCVGRKRVANEQDYIKLYVRDWSNQQINGFIKKLRDKFDNALLAISNEEQYHIVNERQNDNSGIIINVPVGVDEQGNTIYEKRLSITKFARFEYLIYNLYPAILNTSYKKYISKLFGFYYSMSGQCEYNFMSKESDNLTAYLNFITGKALLTTDDRKALIETIHATNKNGKLLKGIETLNGVLKEQGFPHRIMKYSTTVGDKRYRNAWKVINPQE